MSIGEVISALSLRASSWSDDADYLLMVKDVYDIKVHDDHIDISFTDDNTRDIRIGRDGHETD